MRRFLHCNGLTLATLGLFLLTLVGQFFAGRAALNAERHDHGQPPIAVAAYVHSSHFWQALAENWESEFLQMSMFVVLTVKLYQKGSPESNDPDDVEDNDPHLHRDDPKAPWPVRRGGWVCTLYSHSLSLAFALLFIASFVLHIFAGAAAYNAQQLVEGGPSSTTFEYFCSGQFWFESMQNWQSEYLSLAAMVWLSVYLRERGSAESKKVASPHDDHE